MKHLLNCLIKNLSTLNDVRALSHHLSTNASEAEVRDNCQKLMLMLEEFHKNLPAFFTDKPDESIDMKEKLIGAKDHLLHTLWECEQIHANDSRASQLIFVIENAWRLYEMEHYMPANDSTLPKEIA